MKMVSFRVYMSRTCFPDVFSVAYLPLTSSLETIMSELCLEVVRQW